MTILMLLAAPLPQDDERFLLESDFGESSRWTESYLDQAWEVLVRLMDNRKVDPPLRIRVSLKKDENLKGIGGYASSEEIGFVSDAWPKDKHRLWIVAHELSNLFAHHYGGDGGYPSDWWSNGRSAFPEYLSCLIMEDLGYKEAAADRKAGHRGKSDHELFWKLDEEFGFKLFARFFRLLRSDGMALGDVGAPWPHPDETRTAYAIAYLSLAAGRNLAKRFEEQGIGREPDDWRRIHPEIPFRAYQVSEGEVERILAVRDALFSKPIQGEGAEILKDLYRNGRTYTADEESYVEVATQDVEPIAEETAPGDSPVALEVHSDFGSESLWTKDFLARTATALVKVMGIEDGVLPGSVSVNILKDAEIGGISGGARKDSIDLVSDCWPQEQFRLWILSQELAEWMILNLGGSLAGDGWSFDAQVFATYAACLALDEIGYEREADWIRSMHEEQPYHVLFFKLQERHGTAWIPRFFGLLREDGMDFEQLPPQKRGLYLAAYLSLSCRQNLAPLMADLGMGGRPPDWESRFPGIAFEECRITSEGVDQLMKRRNELFGRKTGSQRLRRRQERFRWGE